MSDFDEWYPRECPHLEGCPSIVSRVAGDCACLGGAR